MSINLNWAGGSVPCHMKWDGELYRNPFDMGSREEKEFLKECENKVRKELGCIDEDEIYFLPNCSTAITIVMNSFDTCYSDPYCHHAVFVHENYTGEVDGDLYCTISANAETGLLTYNREECKKLKKQGKAIMLDISQTVGKQVFCASVEPVDYILMSTRKTTGWTGSILIVKAGSPELKPLVRGSQNKLFAGTQDLINAHMCAESIVYHNNDEHYRELWHICADKVSNTNFTYFKDSIPSTFTFVGDFPAEIVKTRLMGKVDFSTGSVCNDGSMSDEPFRQALGVEGGLIRLSFGPESTKDEVEEAIDLILKDIEEIS